MSTYIIYQDGAADIFTPNATAATRALCDLFGLDFTRMFEKIMTQLEGIPPNKTISHPDMSVTIRRY